jgi:hypothetical protein
MPGGVAQVIALVVLVALLAVLVTFAWRLSRWLMQTRRLLSFQVAVAGIAHRAEDTLATVSERVDAVRRGMQPGEEITADLARAMDLAAEYAAEAQRLQPPPDAVPIISTIVSELARAGRAIEMVDHGCHLVETGGRGEHDPEAQTSIKRGYLNLLHARESIAEQATAAAGLPVPGPRFLAQRVAREVREPEQ